MHTSYFSKSSKYPCAVSIARRSPDSYTGRRYSLLAPDKWFFLEYKDKHDQNLFTERYYREVLGKLDPVAVAEELGSNAVLLCWEKSDVFCHRHLVAEWLRSGAGIIIDEL